MRPPSALLEALHRSGRGLPLWMLLQGVAMAAAFAWFVGRSRGGASRLRLCLLLSFGGAAAGGALLGVLVRVPAWLRSGGPASALFGGVVAYGALAGLVGTYAALARARGVPAGAALDRLAPCLGVLVVFGRLGCFFAGCDHGRVTGVPWAVRFPAPSPAFADHLANGLVLASDRRSLPVHPTQLYEAALGVAMTLVALAASRRGARAGAAFWSAALVYATGRLFIDGLRGDFEALAWGPLTPSQWISVVVLLLALGPVGLRRAAAVSDA